MTIKLRGGNTAEDPRLDRLVQFDEASRNFPVTAALPAITWRSVTWPVGLWLDQGKEGACVGFSRVHALAAEPDPVPAMSAEVAQRLYRRAQQIDEWAGEAYEGTSVLAGLKAAREAGLIRTYRWAFTLDEAIAGLAQAPAVIGVNWYEGMFSPNRHGYLLPEGKRQGGHAIVVSGIRLVWKGKDRRPDSQLLDQGRSYVQLHNSWGRRWGAGGGAKLALEHFDRLRREDGDVSFAIDLPPVT